jgi:hypothetical protein
MPGITNKKRELSEEILNFYQDCYFWRPIFNKAIVYK